MKANVTILDAIGATGPFADTRPLRLAEVELAPPGPDELLVRIDAAGLCHSDLSVINGDRPRPMPMALGHEGAATVIAAGEVASRDFSEGDRVVLTFLPICGTCPACTRGEGWLCAEGAAANGRGELLCGGSRISEGDCPIHHHLGASAFASHAVVDRRSVVKVDRDIPPEIAALFGCAVLTGVGAVLNSAGVKPGERVAVYGLGGVGLAAVMGALAADAGEVFAIDPLPAKRDLAADLGAIAFAPDEVPADLTPDVVIETVGKAAVLEVAYALARRGGRIVTVGLPNPAEMFSISAVNLVADAKTVGGSYLGSSIPARDIPRYIDLWRAGRLPVERLLTSVSPLGEINALFDRLASGEAVRQVVVP